MLGGACQSPPSSADPPAAARLPTGSNTAHRARAIATARLAQEIREPLPPVDVPSRVVGPTETQPATIEQVELQVTDPAEEAERVLALMRSPGITNEEKDELRRLLERVQSIRRDRVVRLSLYDAIRRTLLNSYAIQVQAYNPAIDSTRVVEAEAQFDAVFFTDFIYNKVDRPTGQIVNTESDTRVWDMGLRKLLSTGATVQASYNITRTKTNLTVQALNPSYFNQFAVDFRQPLLRGFGLDFNRAQIELRKLDRAISLERMQVAVRDTIFNVEQAYWRLVQARRNITITARLLSSLETIFNSLWQRLQIGYDVYIVQVRLTQSRIEQHNAEFIRERNDLKNAESVLKRLINDPELNQALDIEIIPVDAPSLTPMVLDQLSELTAALEYRPELHEAKLAIEQAQIAVGVAKNQALPQLDLLLRYIIDGLGGNWGRAFSQLSQNDFNEYVVQLQFQWPIGARAGEAAIRRARLQQAQAVATSKDQIESVILDVTQAIRDLQSAYDQVGPSLRAAIASQEQVRATVARMERRDPASLEVELNAHEALANSRQLLIQNLASYNIGIVNLERQKGTLLRYNNIVLRGVDDESYLQPCRPIGP